MSGTSLIYNPQHVARWLLIAIMIGLLLSPPLVGLIEGLLVLVILGSSSLRAKIIGVWQQPLAKVALIFYLLICIGTFYSIAPIDVTLRIWKGWRKLLLLPIALALFTDVLWKQRLLLIFSSVVTVFAIFSFYVWFIGYTFPIAIDAAGIVFRNYVTQAMIFSVAAFSAAMLMSQFQDNKIKIILAACATVLSTNIIMIAHGRSGYITLMVCTVIVANHYLQKLPNLSTPMVLTGTILSGVVLGVILLFAPASRVRIAQGIEEAQNYQQAVTKTSVGSRIIFWRNTLALLTTTTPLLGFGTGSFETAYTKHVAGLPGIEGEPSADPHNQYMKVAVEHGFVGLVIFLAFLGSAFWQQPTDPLHRLLGIGVMVAWMMSSMVNSHFATFAEGTFIYLWLGAMLAESETKPIHTSHD